MLFEGASAGSVQSGPPRGDCAANDMQVRSNANSESNGTLSTSQTHSSEAPAGNYPGEHGDQRIFIQEPVV